ATRARGIRVGLKGPALPVPAGLPTRLPRCPPGPALCPRLPSPLKRISISLYASVMLRMPTSHLPFELLHGALKAAGEGTRLRILALLADAELTVSDLTTILRQSQPRISRHLRLLAEAGLIDRFREGSWAFFRLAERGGAAEMAKKIIDL